MSALASSQAAPASVALAVSGVVPAGPAVHEVEAAEQKRWMFWFGLPALIAAFFVGAVFATGQEWYLALAIAAIVADIGVLVWLAMSSDTNSLIGDHSQASH